MSHSTSYTNFSDRKPNKEKPCKVLLVCIYETVIFEITNALIFEKFNCFGNIIKILIFQKGEVTKFFIEYSQTEQASEAKTKLDGSKFFENICKMNIYYSNFNNVDLKHDSTEGADYVIIEKRHNQFVQNFDNLTKSSHQKNIDYLDDDMLLQAFSPFTNSNSFARSKTDNPKTLEAQMRKMQLCDKMNMIQEEQVDRSIKNQIQSLLSQGQFKDIHSQRSLNVYNSVKKPLNMSMKQQIYPQSNNSIISYDLKEWVQLKPIYNLFSNFGNIECIISKKQKVYIKFRSGYFAAVAINYLNGTRFCGNLLNLKYCENPEQYFPRPLEYSQTIYFDQSFDRFTPKRSITVNPPSETLHVSSIKKQNCNEGSLRRIFGTWGNIERVKILLQSNEKNMALVKFGSLEQSFFAISELHNKMVAGRKMQISFTKSKL